MIRVVAAGVFDGIHDGHRYYLQRAKRLGDHLTVIIARDATIPIIKGKRPRYSERERRAAVARLPEVDRAVLGFRVRSKAAGERFRILRVLKPHVICLGYDQPVHTRKLRAYLNTHGLRRTRIVRVRKAPLSA
jgi:cytidyltransferase-like protein